MQFFTQPVFILFHFLKIPAGEITAELVENMVKPKIKNQNLVAAQTGLQFRSHFLMKRQSEKEEEEEDYDFNLSEAVVSDFCSSSVCFVFFFLADMSSYHPLTP